MTIILPLVTGAFGFLQGLPAVVYVPLSLLTLVAVMWAATEVVGLLTKLNEHRFLSKAREREAESDAIARGLPPQSSIDAWRQMVADVMERVNYGDDPLWLLEGDARFLALEPRLTEEERRIFDGRITLPRRTTLPKELYAVKEATTRLERGEVEPVGPLIPSRKNDQTEIDFELEGGLNSVALIPGFSSPALQRPDVMVLDAYFGGIVVRNHDSQHTYIDKVWLEVEGVHELEDPTVNANELEGTRRIEARSQQRYRLRFTQALNGTIPIEEGPKRVVVKVSALGFGVIEYRIPEKYFAHEIHGAGEW